MSTNQQIALNGKVTTLISQIAKEMKTLQTQINEKNSILTNLITGICLNADLDLQKQGVNLSEDFTYLTVYDLPSDDKTSTEESSNPVPAKTTKAKKAKM